MKKAIITKQEHIYDPVNNKSAKMIRCIVPNGGIHFSDTGLTAYTQVFAQTFDDDGNEELILVQSKESEYTNEEIDGIFTMLNNPIYPNESFSGEFNGLLINFLLMDSKSQGLFNNDDYDIYINKL